MSPADPYKDRMRKQCAERKQATPHYGDAVCFKPEPRNACISSDTASQHQDLCRFVQSLEQLKASGPMQEEFRALAGATPCRQIVTCAKEGFETSSDAQGPQPEEAAPFGAPLRQPSFRLSTRDTR